MSDTRGPDQDDSASEPSAAAAGGRRLPCGLDPIEVIDRARDGHSTAHEQDCPHCQAAIASDAVAHDAAGELARAERDDPVPQTLLPNVMRSVWSDLRRSTMIPLTTDAGSAFVADHAVAAVIDRALDRLTELHIHTCVARLAAAAPDPVSAAAASGTIAVDVRAAAAYNTDVRSVAAEARDIARRTVTEQFGWTAGPIDIEIVDVYLPGGVA